MRLMNVFAKIRGESGPWIAWLHAFPLDQSMWADQEAALSTSYRVLTIDAPGFGQSPVVDSWAIDSFADSIVSELDSLNIQEPIILGGLSMGGYVALAFARRHPTRLQALILADTRCEPDTPDARLGRVTSMEVVRLGGTAALVEAMLPNALGATILAHKPAVVRRFRDIGSAQKSEATLAALVALRDRPDAEPGLTRINVPTLVMVGEEDKITPPSAAEKLHRNIPGSKLTTIPRAGHLANLEQPESFNSEVLSFLESLKK
jgi:3-oxoadipate enol-lactonase